MMLVVVESPFAGEVERNIAYARRAVAHSLSLGEAPIASHLLYTQPGVLDDGVPEQRRQGITAGLEWAKLADRAVFYTDLGWSSGMSFAREFYLERGIPMDERQIGVGA